MQLQKGVCITINAISALSGSHIKAKLEALNGLITGKTIHVGAEAISTRGLPQAILFCQNLIAKKLVVSIRTQLS